MSNLDYAILAHFSPGFGGTVIPDWLKSWLDKGLGGVTLFSSNCPSLEETAALIAEIRRYSPKVIISIDEEGGDVTRLFVREGSPFPTPAMLGKANDLQLTNDVFFELGKILRQIGVDLNFAPVGDVPVRRENPIVGVRAFSDDFEIVCNHLVQAVAGMQRAGVAACIKHFPGHGGVEEDSHHVLPKLNGSLEELQSTHLAPFLRAIEAKAQSVMVGHIITPALDGENPASLSKKIITDYLKGELGFGGIVVTDALDMGALGGTKKIASSALRAISAGADLLCFSGLFDQSLFVESSFALIKESAMKDETLAKEIIERSNFLTSWQPPQPEGSSAKQPLPIGKIAAGFEIHGDVKINKPNVQLIELSADPTIAAGFVAWGMRRAISKIGKSVKLESSDSAHKIDPDSQLVVAFRDAYRDKRILNILGKIEQSHPQTIFVDMGWPTYSFAPKNIIRTFGSSAVASDAAALYMS